jgi:hypothetical protein
MIRNVLLAALGVIVLLGVAPAQAKDCQGVSFPDQLQVDGRTLALNGLGLRQATLLKINVYVAALYVTKPSADANLLLGSTSPKQLVLQFLRDVSAAELIKAWVQGFDIRLAPFKEYLETLKGWMADMKTGQRLTFVHRPGTGLEVDVNGAAKGTIKGDDFAKAFFSIWLGANTPNRALKSGLLGGVCG